MDICFQWKHWYILHGILKISVQFDEVGIPQSMPFGKNRFTSTFVVDDPVCLGILHINPSLDIINSLHARNHFCRLKAGKSISFIA